MGSGIWTVRGIIGDAGPWTIQEGTLQVDQAAILSYDDRSTTISLVTRRSKGVLRSGMGASSRKRPNPIDVCVGRFAEDQCYDGTLPMPAINSVTCSRRVSMSSNWIRSFLFQKNW
ncbi:hypothetical protein DFP91_2067 [Pseudorhodoplanes sinuspersici]|nr:hypothetical protein DFP91_2067 [Pseudorhodoplanes sinuspersici]